MKTILLLAIAATLAGCSTNPLNREFRRNVSAVNLNEQVQYDPTTGASGTFGQSFILRNPDGLSK